jgi:phage FluMu gp28-like protein
MAVPVPGVANPIRFDNVVENYRALQKTKPEFTFEYGLKSMLTIFTLHDFSMFHVLEEEFGTEKAVNLYAKIWERRTDLEPEDTMTMDKFAELMEIYFDTFGNPLYLAEKSEERYTFRVTDCPYTTEVLWKMFSPEENLAYNDKIQVSCNTAIFDRFLKLTGLEKDWTFGFPSQLCRSGQYCEFTFVRKHF